MAASVVRAVRGETTLGEVALSALSAGDSMEVSIPMCPINELHRL